ncbi:Hypothetical protein, putative [Bodo saltans]|uniref:Uncharacterized protein n=1 Tax=Bodo saltans TaxID=75058 RepID=A0A0S4JPD6_BODSA|nr:Hypothetical protein, putative [Bodo saltans]|eukprot:CUG92549.1 Hypothetical protein, putative [Bodo saltans]
MSACRPGWAASFVGPRRRGETNCLRWVHRQGLSDTRNVYALNQFARVVNLLAFASAKTNVEAVLKNNTDCEVLRCHHVAHPLGRH